MRTMLYPDGREDARRLVTGVQLELRDSGDEMGAYTIRGHAAVFNELSHDLGGFREMIAPGAFAEVLKDAQDVRCLINHDLNLVLGRSSSQTLELREDAVGLRVWCKAPRGVSYAQDLRVLMQRGDVNEMSFGFSVGEDDWKRTADGQVIREIRSVKELFDVSVVTIPAYPQTDADMRSLYDVAERMGRIPGGGPDASAVLDESAGGDASAVPGGAGGEVLDLDGRRLVVSARSRLRRLELDSLNHAGAAR